MSKSYERNMSVISFFPSNSSCLYGPSQSSSTLSNPFSTAISNISSTSFINNESKENPNFIIFLLMTLFLVLHSLLLNKCNF